jgi:hypothetical protein
MNPSRVPPVAGQDFLDRAQTYLQVLGDIGLSSTAVTVRVGTQVDYKLLDLVGNVLLGASGHGWWLWSSRADIWSEWWSGLRLLA